MIYRGQIFFVFLDPVFGHEIGGYKTRPVVVVSTDALNRNTGVVTVVPGTSTDSDYWNVVRVQGNATNGLTATTYFQCQQVRAIDGGRMTSAPIGRLSRPDLDRVEKTLWRTLGWINDAEQRPMP